MVQRRRWITAESDICGYCQRSELVARDAVAEVEDIDNVCVYGAGHFRDINNPADLRGPRWLEPYMEGEYGQKTGKGWYDYDKKGANPTKQAAPF